MRITPPGSGVATGGVADAAGALMIAHAATAPLRYHRASES
ncbi:hypothetical protein [Nocardia huaxiensis]|nr:hypothetical protein [Nocardia huaxiensis]